MTSVHVQIVYERSASFMLRMTVERAACEEGVNKTEDMSDESVQEAAREVNLPASEALAFVWRKHGNAVRHWLWASVEPTNCVSEGSTRAVITSPLLPARTFPCQNEALCPCPFTFHVF